MSNKRIDIIDGFRFLAILIVMLYHFYSAFLDYYSYEFDGSIFKFGELGVQFFFIISGFVIFITLDKSKNFLEFIKKRYLRLMPGMLICSIITFSIFNLFNSPLYPPAKKIKNLLFSNTFLSTGIPNKLFGANFNYIDTSYWSLWVEILFYVLISLLFFYNKSKVILYYSIISISGTLLYYFFGSEENVLQLSIYHSMNKILSYIPFVNFLIWFLIGIIISKLYHNNKEYKYTIYLIFLFSLLFITSRTEVLRYFVVISAVLWMIFLYKNTWISFFGSDLLSKLGRSSYSVYLIHQLIGVLFIIKVSPYFGSFNWILPIILIIIFFAFGLFSFDYLEKPIGKILYKILFKKK